MLPPAASHPAGIPRAARLPRSIIEYYYKNEASRPDGGRGHITLLVGRRRRNMDDIVALTLRIQTDCPHRPVPGSRITLVDFKVNSAAMGERGDAHRAGRRDQPG